MQRPIHSKHCYAFAASDGRITISTRLPRNAMPVAKGPRQALFELIAPRAVTDSTGLRVPMVNPKMTYPEVVETVVSWSERLARYNSDSEITMI